MTLGQQYPFALHISVNTLGSQSSAVNITIFIVCKLSNRRAIRSIKLAPQVLACHKIQHQKVRIDTAHGYTDDLAAVVPAAALVGTY